MCHRHKLQPKSVFRHEQDSGSARKHLAAIAAPVVVSETEPKETRELIFKGLWALIDPAALLKI